MAAKSRGERRRDRLVDIVESLPEVEVRSGKGWLALRIDLPKIDWGEVGELVVSAYRLQAPKKLLRLLE